ncbi:hypothetical protein [Paraconexibacter sp.]|uniref:hypothetical protein n=1 Tax=Paraconexibacter sp. TaxID=2949640 RepID=UPI003566FC5B
MDAVPADSTTRLQAEVQALLRALDADHRRVAADEWGLSVECSGWPLHIGLAVRGGLLRVQAEVLGPGRLAPEKLLHRNRLGVLVRFAHTRAGAVWLQGELPAAAVDATELDRLLGVLMEAASWARQAAAEDPASPPA